MKDDYSEESNPDSVYVSKDENVNDDDFIADVNEEEILTLWD